jgi:hypothetical protein
MKRYELNIDIEAIEDIQQATDWYNEQLQGLGTRFQAQVRVQINSLKISHNKYAIRYKSVRYMLIRKFLYLVHFVVDDRKSTVEVIAVIHTSRNPKIWFKRKKSKR